MLTLLIVFAGMTTSSQDVVVMRRTIAAPAPKPAPSPTPAPSARWDAGEWTTPVPTQCPHSITRTRTVRCLDGSDATTDEARCTGERPASSETVLSYTACATNFSCTTWVPDKQGAGGPHYLVYNSVADATEEGRRLRAQKLCEAQPRKLDIQICTSMVIETVGQPDTLRVFASRGYAIDQKPNVPISSNQRIKTSSIAMCAPLNP
jgi:hypothetical protein